MTNVSEDVEKEEFLCTICGNVNYCSHCGKQYGSFFQKKKKTKLKLELTYDWGVLLLDIYSPPKLKHWFEKISVFQFHSSIIAKI